GSRRKDPVHQTLFVAALRHAQRDPVAAQRESLFDELLLDQPMTEQQKTGFRAIIVELPDERSQNFLDRELAIMRGKMRPVAPVLSATEEKDLDASLSTLLMRSDDVSIYDPGDMDVVVPLNQRQGANAVPDQRCGLEVESVCGFLHLGREALLDVVTSTREENPRLLDQRCVILAANAADAGRTAASDLVQQAGPRAGRKNAIAARAQQKSLLQGHQGAVHRAGRG